MKQALFIIIAVVFAGYSSAADLTVFGLELGKPMTLPACSSVATTHYGMVPAVTCVTEPHATVGYLAQPRRVKFSEKDMPQWVQNWNLVALEIDGNLQGVNFETFGAQSQDDVLAVLQQKYGKPSAIERRKVQNLVGASFDGITAHWNFPDLSVTFEGIGEKMDVGHVTVDLPAATKLRAQWAAAQDTGKRL